MTIHRSMLRTASGFAIAAALAAGGAAHAQTTADTTKPNANATGVAEVVVTASRTTENIQKVPAAVAALSGQQLEKKDVTQLADLQYATPSLSITNAALTQNVNIRGIGLASGNPNVEPGVPVYLDWLVQPPIVGTTSFFDIGEAEVYRGPQGTFAGANSEGGAVFITSNSPTLGSGVSGNIEGWGGDYTDLGLRGAINMPISDDLAVRLAFNAERRNSFFHDIGNHTATTDGPYETPGSLNEKDVRLGVLWRPINNLSVLLKVAGTDNETGGYAYRPIPGTVDAPFATSNPWTLDFNTPEQNNEQSVRTSLEIKYVLPDGITLRSVSGYQTNQVADLYDSDATAALSSYEDQSVLETPVSQEFNILSPSGGKLNWIVGAFYYHDYIKVGIDLQSALGAPHTYVTILTTKISEAGFGRVQYDLTPSLQLEVGARYTQDTVDDGGQVVIGFPGGPTLATIPQPGHYSGNNWTGKVALNYTLNDANFLYVLASKGAKAGGANGPTNFQQETVWDYEAGWKSQLFDDHMRIQLDGFYNDYQNFQVDALNPASGQIGPTNTKGATIDGAELQVQGKFGGLSVDFGGAYVHSTIGPVTLINIHALPGGGGTNLGTQCAAGVPSNPPVCFNYAPYFVSVEGKDNPYAPEWTYNFGAEYNFDFAQGGTLTPRINYSYQGTQWATLLEASTDRIRAHGIWDASLTYATGPYSLVGYVTNLANVTYVSGQFANNEFLGAPRQFGVRASYKF